jgi:hypothetical protein
VFRTVPLDVDGTARNGLYVYRYRVRARDADNVQGVPLASVGHSRQVVCRHRLLRWTATLTL